MVTAYDDRYPLPDLGLSGRLCPQRLVIGKVLYHTDPREYGSHNTGATNAYRVFGAVGGLLVLICDVAKGMFGVYLGQLASQAGIGTPADQSIS